MFHLIELYDEWLTDHNLPKGYSADELHIHADVTPDQQEWLETYIKLWELSGF